MSLTRISELASAFAAVDPSHPNAALAALVAQSGNETLAAAAVQHFETMPTKEKSAGLAVIKRELVAEATAAKPTFALELTIDPPTDRSQNQYPQAYQVTPRWVHSLGVERTRIQIPPGAVAQPALLAAAHAWLIQNTQGHGTWLTLNKPHDIERALIASALSKGK